MSVGTLDWRIDGNNSKGSGGQIESSNPAFFFSQVILKKPPLLSLLNLPMAAFGGNDNQWQRGAVAVGG